jgi:outer membrane beta-barrel protein
MKRAAVCLFVWFAIAGWAADGHAKKGGGGKAAPAPAADDQAGADQKADAPADQTAAPADTGQAAGATPGESLETEEGKPGKVEEGAEVDTSKAGAAKAQAQQSTTTLAWRDIVVVPRKAFLKGGRFEFAPFTGVSINDNLIRHYAFGADINFFLTDVLWVGVQGQYFIKQLTEREDLIGLQYNRIPTLNHYLYGGALNFGYVPVYGKFAWFNKGIMHWEIWISAGIGYTKSETIPRNPGTTPFKNDLLTPNVGIGSRFFLFNWVTVNFALRDYFVPDKFERVPNTTPDDPAAAKANATSALVNNLMFYVGVGFYLPTGFQYKTPR